MRVVELDASDWKTPADFINALKKALDAPFWCGNNVDAINELMVWGLGPVNELPPSCAVNISNISRVSDEVRRYIVLQAECVHKALKERKERDGINLDVSIKI
jgi:hypothetical protein